jgi:DNA repair protein RadA/Sms
MTKLKSSYSCRECGSLSHKWSGQCVDCYAWNSISEIIISTNNANLKNNKLLGFTGLSGQSGVTDLSAVEINEQSSFSTGLPELDRALGSNGIVSGSVILIGGDPGIGKSTILLQALAHISHKYPVLYVTGEESLSQVKLRANRLGLQDQSIKLLAETNVDLILQIALEIQPKIMVIDSVQTIYTELLQAAPGSVSQVREASSQVVQFAKKTGISVILIGHVTKDGSLAGPRVLEHMVDTVLYFEGQIDNRYRILRAVKNRFGAVNELGIFVMTDSGLKGVNNPSALFLSRDAETASGSIVMATKEGSRPLLVEIQALVDESHVANPRRLCVGMDPNRLALILAVLHRHCGIITYNQDIFVNIVGGVKITEPGIDLPVILAILSSLKNKPIPKNLIAFGEVGLTGEIRPVQDGQARLKEAVKLGFKQAIIPKANMINKSNMKEIELMDIMQVRFLQEAVS